MRRATVLAVAGFVASGLLTAFLVDRWVATTELPVLALEVSQEVLAEDGRLLRAFTVEDGRWRFAVTPGGVDPRYVEALIAFEDRRFHRHAGVDARALLRAAWQALRYRELVSGGSTLTMQVARLLEGSGTGRWSGKLRQVRVALALERTWRKDEILEAYLLLAPMTGNLEGVRAGSLAWFGKEPGRLRPEEMALLIALPQAPTARHPVTHPEQARSARDRVLERLADVGVFSAEELASALSAPVPGQRQRLPSLAPHVADRLVAARPTAIVHRTTLDAEWQASLEALVRSSLTDLPPTVSIAMLVAEVETGLVRASVGSADYGSDARDGYVDMTQAFRSPGSTLKPLVYALAFSDGLAHPETIVFDEPSNYGGYAPQNFDRAYRGPVSAREALQASLNLPVVALTEALGPARIEATLGMAGVEARLLGDVPGLSVSLGGLDVTLEGLVTLYAALARGGIATPLMMHSGGDSASSAARIVSEEAAWYVSDVLAGGQPGSPARTSVALKTGTSHGHRDAWTIGFDGAHVVGVWVGRPDGSAIPGLYGTDVARPLVEQAFARIAERSTPLPSPPAGALQVSNSALPLPLRVFGTRTTALSDVPRFTFPMDGAVLTPLAGGIPARVERGQEPYTWFLNGLPVVRESYDREVRLPHDGPGFATLSVRDAAGQAASVSIEVR